MLIFVYFWLFVYLRPSASLTWKWRYDLNADNPENYQISQLEENCMGFHFPEFKEICMMSIFKLETNELFLPTSGDIYLKEGAEIVVNPDIKKCVRVKPSSYKLFIDPDSWLSIRSSNRAVPHSERIPCECDEIKFPEDLYSVSFPSFEISVKKIDFGIELKDESCPLRSLEIGGNVYSDPDLCEDEKICRTTKIQEAMDELCPVVEEGVQCDDAIELVGHCSKFCGAVIWIQEKTDVSPNDYLGFLLDENLVYYYSKVLKNKKIVMQISITDKNEYSGFSSLKIEENQQKIIEKAHNLGIKSIDISTSGSPRKSSAIHGLSIVFGTLIFVLLTFGIIYAKYEKRWIKINFTFDRFPDFNLSRYNQALRRSVIFSRFDNVENVSIAGSVLSLERQEFSNPLYEKADEERREDRNEEKEIEEDEECEKEEEGVEETVSKDPRAEEIKALN